MNYNLPVILLKILVILPHGEVRIELNNDISKKVIAISSKYHDDKLLVVCPIDQKEENPEVSDLPNIGVVAHIKSKIELPNGNIKIVLTGEERVNIQKYVNYSNEEEILESICNKIEIAEIDEIKETAFLRKLLDLFHKLIKKSPKLSNSILSSLTGITELSKLTDLIASFMPLSFDKKINLMKENNPINRATILIKTINIELELLILDENMDIALQKEMEKTNKNFIIKEKIKFLKKELGEENSHDNNANLYREKLNDLQIDNKSKIKIEKEIFKFENMSEMSPEVSSVRGYLDLILNLPWNLEKKEETNILKVKKSLDETHYGMNNLKERIIEYLAVKKRNPKINCPIICLVGPPGVGKTSFTFSLAKALNRDFCKISVGGLNDVSELVGHRRTYIGASPGKIIANINKSGSNNPIMLIDEVDKMVKDYKGDPASALLEILDPEQNKIFVDNYLEEPFDLSKVLFILTANNIENIPPELKDRLEIIEINSYSEIDKVTIAKNYIIPKILQNHLVKNNEIIFSDAIILKIIRHYTSEGGVRELSRSLSKIVRKVITKSITNNNKINIKVTKDDLLIFLGQFKYKAGSKVANDFGVVNSLAFTPIGGLVMNIETILSDGHENIILTGLLGKIMQESVKVSISYIKSHYNKLNLNINSLKNVDIHVHALAAAINKEGPSAGTAITTSIISAVLKKRISNSVAMTGEISLNGCILKVGGLKDKIIGAYNNNIKTVYIPYDNKNELIEIPEKIKNKIKIIPVKNYIEIFNDLF